MPEVRKKEENHIDTVQSNLVIPERDIPESSLFWTSVAGPAKFCRI
jgi:hypothetical protein